MASKRTHGDTDDDSSEGNDESTSTATARVKKSMVVRKFTKFLLKMNGKLNTQ